MSAAAMITESREIALDEVFPHTPDVVWKTLVNPELMARWLGMTPSGFEAAVGNRFTYQTTPAGAWDGVIRCEVLAVIPSERLVYTWTGGHEANVGYGSRLETVVTWTLAQVDRGTRLRLVHSGFRKPNASAFTKMSEGWVKVLQRIDSVAGEQDPAKTPH